MLRRLTWRRWSVAPCLFGAFWSFYLLSASGRPFGIDGTRYFEMAESLALRRSVAILSEPDGTTAKIGLHGQVFSKYAPLQAVVEVPILLALTPIGDSLTPGNATRAGGLRTWVPIVTNSMLSAATVALVYVAVKQMGYTGRIALSVSLLLGLSTLTWPYARWDFSEPLQGLSLLAAFMLLRRVRPVPWTGAPLGVGLAIGSLILTKALYVVVVPIVFVALLSRVRHGPAKTVTLILVEAGMPVTGALAVYLAYNRVRFGSWLEFGYNEPFGTPLLVGLYGLLFSSGKSLFLYCPILIPVVAGAARFFRSHRFEAIFIGALSATVLTTHARFWAWHGDWSWGPRFAVPLLPLLVLPLASLLSSAGRVPRAAIVGLGIVGIGVQTLGVTVDPGNYLSVQLTQVTGRKALMIAPSPQDIHYNPYLSPLVGHWWLLRASLEHIVASGDGGRENRTLQDLPWRPIDGRPRWRPPHPEYAIGIDIWALQQPTASVRWTGVSVMALPALAVLLYVALVGCINLALRMRVGWRMKSAQG